MSVNPDIITLYRYYVYALQMRTQFRVEMSPELKSLFLQDFNSLVLFFYSPPGMYFCYSYSGIYLVIEGWKELKLSDEAIDNLILSPFVDRLRLFRNATFHYQKEIISQKLLQFFGSKEEATELWLNEIYDEFGRFFKENSFILPEELQSELKDENYYEMVSNIRKYISKK